MVANVAIVGVGLVGKQVVHQLTSPSLRRLFNIISLTNSKHTASIAAEATRSLDGQALLALLPASSDAAPSQPSPGVTYAAADPRALVHQLAADSKKSQVPTVLVDCTSDLSVTELYPLAIAAGLSIVTPNKKGFSSADKLWQDIIEAQSSSPEAGLVYLEATVGAGLPIISTLRDLLKTGDEVTKIEGVFSGTMSYIFNEFSKPGTDSGPKFSDVVKIAKENGYTVSFLAQAIVLQTRWLMTDAGARLGTLGTSPS